MKLDSFEKAIALFAIIVLALFFWAVIQSIQGTNP